MVHLLMYSTNYTVCRLSACLCPRAESALAAPRDRKFSRLPSDSPCNTISVFQVLAEALTTSKGMVGRRLFAVCQNMFGDFGSSVKKLCDDYVRKLDVTSWVPNLGRKVAVRANELKVAAETATNDLQASYNILNAAKNLLQTNYNDLQTAASKAAKEAERTLKDAVQVVNDAKDEAVRLVNDIKDAAVKAADDAVNAANNLTNIAESSLADITSGVTTIGNKIKCAASLPQPRD
eukprot:scaffold42984_cov63-Phaeocystis_antarctica.AAC.2